MKYLFLTGAIIFGVTGISQAMDAFLSHGADQLAASKLVFDLQYLTISFTPLPGFVRVLILSAGLFSLYLIWRKLKLLGIGSVSDYIPE